MPIPQAEPYHPTSVELLRGTYEAHPETTIMRLIATIDALRAEVDEVRVYTGAAADEKTMASVVRTMAFIAKDAAPAAVAKANADGAHDAARAMRAACAAIAIEMAKSANTLMAMSASAIATAIEALPLPPKADDGTADDMCRPAPGAAGRVLYKDERVTVCRVTLEPGAEWPEETHDSDKEHVFFVSGTVRLFVEYEAGIENQWQIDSSAGIAGIPCGCRHTIRNDSATAPAEYISVLRRA